MRPPARLAALLLLAAAGCGAGDASAPGAVASAARRPAAPAFTLKDVSGASVSLASMKGRLVLLDFWATWCPPCRMSIPALEKLHREYGSRGLHVVGVSLDEDPSSVPSFMQRMGMTYQVLIGANDDASSHYGVQALPTFFLIDKEGAVAREWQGFDPSFPDEWRDAVDRLLAEG